MGSTLPIFPKPVNQTAECGCKDAVLRLLRGGLRIEQAEFLAAASSSQGLSGMSELVRRYPSNRPLPSIELLTQLPEWQRGEAIDLGAG